MEPLPSLSHFPSIKPFLYCKINTRNKKDTPNSHPHYNHPSILPYLSSYIPLHIPTWSHNMSSSTRKKLLRTTSVVVNVGCSCRRPKISAGFLQRRPKGSAPMFGKPNQLYQSSWSSWDRATTQSSVNGFCPSLSTDSSPHYSSDISAAKKKASSSSSSSSSIKATAKGRGRIDQSVAVEKESDDPYLDFRQSMLQMILEKEIYAEADLRELLNCFLALNSPYHHSVIIRAFTEIWSGTCDTEWPEMAVSWRRSRESRGTAPGRGR